MFFEQLADGCRRLLERDAALDDLRPREFKDALGETVVRDERAVRRGRYLESPGNRKTRSRHTCKRTALAANDLEAVVLCV